MTFFLGLLSGVVFFIVLIAGVHIGYRLGNKQTKPREVDETKQNEMNKFNEDFKKIFSYDVATALQRKKV